MQDTLQSQKVDNVAVLFSDIVGFTSIAAAMDESDLHFMLEEMFSMFDEALQRHVGLTKIKTIGMVLDVRRFWFSDQE
jgi:class 3 adenylate cyclase